jgi:hypothetical protein
MSMSAPMVVTPANSREDNGDWLAQIESGVSLSDADWEQLANERVSARRRAYDYKYSMVL